MVHTKTGAVHIASSAASSAAEDIHANCTVGFSSSEPHPVPAASTAKSVLGFVLGGAVRMERSEGSTAFTVGCIDTLGRHLAGYEHQPLSKPLV